MTERDTSEFDRDYSQPEELADDMADWGHRMEDEGTWQRFRGSVREKWGDLTDDEVDQGRGNLDQLIGTIKEKTGEATDSVRDAIRRMAS
jgi:uncharacterized protein YjbJ (UPF0337 family)